MKTREEYLRLWVDALRSGKYQQGRDRLHTIDHEGNHYYCCLGIIAEIAKDDLEMVESEVSYGDEKGQESIKIISYDEQSAVLPDKLIHILNIGTHGSLDNLNNSNLSNTCLVKMNDNGKSFKEIADMIEKEYLQ